MRADNGDCETDKSAHFGSSTLAPLPLPCSAPLSAVKYDAMADLRNLAVNSSSRPSGGSEAGGGEAEGTARSTSQEEVVGTGGRQHTCVWHVSGLS